jgi:hypothetical protein
VPVGREGGAQFQQHRIIHRITILHHLHLRRPARYLIIRFRAELPRHYAPDEPPPNTPAEIQHTCPVALRTLCSCGSRFLAVHRCLLLSCAIAGFCPIHASRAITNIKVGAVS